MDSMRNLNKSLPSSLYPPEELLRSFKTAALSVTNLYKEAAASNTQARQVGYQDALEELLAFLDHKGLGLQEGEGWRVRQWATERQDGSRTSNPLSDSDDDKDAEAKTNVPPPAATGVTAKPDTTPQHNVQARSPPRETNPLATVEAPSQPQAVGQTKKEMFTFKSAMQMPQDTEMHGQEASADTPTQQDHVRVELPPRTARHSQRQHGNKHTSRTSSLKSSRQNCVSKRKLPFGDFFDLGNVGDVKESGHGSSKRLRPS